MSENNNTQAQSIELVLTPEEVEKQQQAALADMEAEQAKIDEQTVKEQYDDKSLTEAERKTVNDFSEKIDIMESNVILQYGSAAQKKVTDFSDNALKNVRTKDLGEIGGLLSTLVTELKGFNANEEEKKGLFGLFKKGTDKAAAFKARYDKAEANVDKIAALLEEHQITLLKDIALLDQLYERNAQNTKELTMYIIAGRKKLAQVRNEEVPKLIEKARQSGLPEDTQAANDLPRPATGLRRSCMIWN